MPLFYADHYMSVGVKHSAVHCGGGSRNTDRPQLAGPIFSNAAAGRSTNLLRFFEGCSKSTTFLVNRSASYLLEEYVPGFWVPKV